MQLIGLARKLFGRNEGLEFLEDIFSKRVLACIDGKIPCRTHAVHALFTRDDVLEDGLLESRQVQVDAEKAVA